MAAESRNVADSRRAGRRSRSRGTTEGTPGSAMMTAAVLVTLLLGITLPILLHDSSFRSAGAWDEMTYHLPTIEQFAREWPHPVVLNYPSATTPGFHLVMAAVKRYIAHDNLQTLRLFGALFSVGLVATLGWGIGARMNAWTAVIVCLPLVCSAYVLSSTVQLLPDNAAWWGVIAVLLIAFCERLDGWTRIRGGFSLLLLVLVRQIHLWAAAPLAVSAWVGDSDRLTPQDSPEFQGRFSRTIRMLLTIIPSILALTAFFALWHGAVPPSARELNAGANFAAPAFALAVLGQISPFFVGFLLPPLRARRDGYRFIVIGALIGAAAALVVATDYNVAAGRWSGLWDAAKALPAPGHRSPFIITLAAVGGAAVAVCFLILSRRDAWIFLAALLAFIAAQMASHFVFQRYFEPFWLLLLPLVVSRIRPSSDRQSRWPGWAGVGPILLVLVSLLTRRAAA